MRYHYATISQNDYLSHRVPIEQPKHENMRTYEKERARQRNDHQLKKAEKERKRKEEERRKVEQWRRREDEKRRKDKEAENMRKIQQTVDYSAVHADKNEW